ncbi:MAG TPA: UDP-N-acetylmuramate dehydrogenase [Polyangiaceae bacterium]|nr:UDP-N-acetylmuramate dehydrogenase [Polyangiaceae bacterium]
MTAPSFEPRPSVSLAARTSLGLGGPAEFFAELGRREQVPEALDWARARGLPVLVLGGGSNVVVAERGIAGLVVSLTLAEESVSRAGDEVEVSIGAGTGWDDFVARCVARDWSGIECLSGIPGQVGATPIQNVGAYGQEVGDTLVRVDVHDRVSGASLQLDHAACEFGYRTSRFKSRDAGRFIVLGATFRLRVGGSPCIAYPEIARRFAAPGAPPRALAEVRQTVLETRRQKSMLLDPSDENGRSCGSFFLNPQLTPSELEQLRARAPSAPPVFPQPDGRFKVPAAWLIEQAGFRRGQRFGAVGISSRHSLALVCHAGATSDALVSAARRVRDGVAQAFGVWLAAEAQFLGFELGTDGLPSPS